MNQILKTKKSSKSLRKFKFQFFLSLLFIILFITAGIIFFINTRKKESISKNLLNAFNIQRLYLQDNKDTIVIEMNKSEKYFVIGVIEIPKINIRYPILSEVNDEFLKISTCRFYGPYPNKVRKYVYCCS